LRGVPREKRDDERAAAACQKREAACLFHRAARCNLSASPTQGENVKPNRFGAHSNDAEYIDIDSIEPRLYLLARMIMDVAQGKDK